MSELVQHNSQQSAQVLATRMDYAQAMAGSSLLPKQYRGQPANLLFALEYADALGVAPIHAITSIHVVEGKPSASADLIASLIRKAGHKLRIMGDDTYAEAHLTRADDPEFTFTVRWDMARARQAGLAGKGVWKQYPGAMLRSRAITEVGRMGAPDALFGVQYTSEELGADNTDANGFAQEPTTPPARKAGGYGIAANMPAKAPRPEDVVEVTHEDEQPAPEAPVLVFASRSQQSRLGKALDAIGVEDNAKKAEEVQRWAAEQGITRDVKKSGDLTVDEMEDLIAELEALAATATAPVESWDTQEVPS